MKDALTGGGSDFVEINGERTHVIGYMKAFLFGPEQARTPIGRLSGGERGRLMLARALARPSNLLVLDEPTNDLDLETLDLLQDMLGDYTGTLLIVSHDRDFLDRVTTSVLVAEGGGRWIEYAGGYSDMVAQRGAGVGGTSVPAAPAAAKAPPALKVKPKMAPAPPQKPKPRLTFKDKTSPPNAAGAHRRAARPQGESPVAARRLWILRPRSREIYASLGSFCKGRSRFDKGRGALA